MELFFRKYGEGTPLIILHGLFGSADNWNTLGKKFGETYATYLVDQRNHGRSPHSDTWTYTAMAEDIKKLLDKEGIEKAHLMGHSMGGKTVMFFSMLFPERVERLIVSDIGTKAYPVHHRELVDTLLAVDLDLIDSRKDAEQYMIEKIPDFGTRQFLLKNLYWKDEKLAWRFNLDVISDQLDNVGEVIPEGVFNETTAFIRGEKSNYIKDEDWSAIQAAYPQSSLITIAGSGHWIHAEKPREYYNEVMKFLA